MKLVRESLNFEEDVDPYKALSIGKHKEPEETRLARAILNFMIQEMKPYSEIFYLSDEEKDIIKKDAYVNEFPSGEISVGDIIKNLTNWDSAYMDDITLCVDNDKGHKYIDLNYDTETAGFLESWETIAKKLNIKVNPTKFKDPRSWGSWEKYSNFASEELSKNLNVGSWDYDDYDKYIIYFLREDLSEEDSSIIPGVDMNLTFQTTSSYHDNDIWGWALFNHDDGDSIWYGIKDIKEVIKRLKLIL